MAQRILDLDTRPGILPPGKAFRPVASLDEAEELFYSTMRAHELGPCDVGPNCGRVVTADDHGYHEVARFQPEWR